MQQASRLAAAVIFGVVLLATCWNGAKVHASALLLRGAVAVGCVLLWPSGDAVVPRKHLLAPIAAMAAVVMGFLLAPNRGIALQGVITVALMVALFVALTVSSRDHTGKLLWLAPALGVVHSLWALGQLLQGRARGSGGFFNPNELAAFLAPAIVLAADAAANVGGRRPRWVWARASLVLLILLLGLWATHSRSGLLAAALGLGVLAVGRFRHRKAVLAALSVIVIVGAASLTERWLGRSDAYSYARFSIWQSSVELALQHPFGVGLNGFGTAMRSFGVPLPADGDVWVRYPRHAGTAHNEILNAWVEMGWLGLLAALLPCLWVVGRIRSGRDPMEKRQPSWFGHWGILAAFAVPASLGSTLHVPPVAFLAVIWAAHLARRDPGSEATVRLPGGAAGRRSVATWVGIACLAALPAALSHIATWRAVALREQGDLGAALQAVSFSQALEPWSLGAQMLAESMLYVRTEDAMASAERLIELAEQFPYSARPLRRAIWLLEGKAADPQGGVLNKKGWAAVVGLRQALVERDPTDAVAWTGLGRAHLNAGDDQASERAFRTALDWEPHAAGALGHLAVMAHEAGQRQQAEQLAARAWRAREHGRRLGLRGHQREVLSLGPMLLKILHEFELVPP